MQHRLWDAIMAKTDSQTIWGCFLSVGGGYNQKLIAIEFYCKPFGCGKQLW